MEHSTEDKVIDFIINRLKFGEFQNVTTYSLKPDFDIDSLELRCIFKIAESEGLIEKKTQTYIGLTKKAFDIQKSGGWLNHLESRI